MNTRRAAAFTDRELADALLADGAEWAFRELYRRHTPRAFQIVLRLNGGRETEAEDLLQETWMRVVEALNAFRWEAAFGTWFVGIAVNVTRMWQRRQRLRETEPVLDDSPVMALAPPHMAERMDLETAIARLPDGYRSVLVLHDVEGFTHEEIGERLGIAAGTSKSQLSAARRAMRTMLQPGRESYGTRPA